MLKAELEEQLQRSLWEIKLVNFVSQELFEFSRRSQLPPLAISGKFVTQKRNEKSKRKTFFHCLRRIEISSASAAACWGDRGAKYYFMSSTFALALTGKFSILKLFRSLVGKSFRKRLWQSFMSCGRREKSAKFIDLLIVATWNYPDETFQLAMRWLRK